jgi:hypothetical protein
MDVYCRDSSLFNVSGNFFINIKLEMERIITISTFLIPGNFFHHVSIICCALECCATSEEKEVGNEYVGVCLNRCKNFCRKGKS